MCSAHAPRAVLVVAALLSGKAMNCTTHAFQIAHAIGADDCPRGMEACPGGHSPLGSSFTSQSQQIDIGIKASSHHSCTFRTFLPPKDMMVPRSMKMVSPPVRARCCRMASRHGTRTAAGSLPGLAGPTSFLRHRQSGRAKSARPPAPSMVRASSSRQAPTYAFSPSVTIGCAFRSTSQARTPEHGGAGGISCCCCCCCCTLRCCWSALRCSCTNGAVPERSGAACAVGLCSCAAGSCSCAFCAGGAR
mmetsp:Transcript_16701/g.45325  ORF Transcript_16701/g.45325 Transcript_16701/m.45325 type:complete len:248 (-) Transcript_16701:772-1515(-)